MEVDFTVNLESYTGDVLPNTRTRNVTKSQDKELITLSRKENRRDDIINKLLK